MADEVEAGQRQFWAGPHSAIITAVVTHPRRKVLEFFLAGGDMRELEAMVEGILTWGREQGCSAAGFTGRKGWAKTFLAKQGWVPSLVLFERQL